MSVQPIGQEVDVFRQASHVVGSNAVPAPGSLGGIKWGGATGVDLVVDRAQDMFFVLMENSLSGHTHVQVNLKTDHIRGV